MADKKVSAFDAAATLDGSELVDGVQAGGNVKITTQAIADLAGGAPGTSALIASAIGVDLDTAGDTASTLSAFATGKFFVVDYCLATNPSTDLTGGNFSVAVSSGAGGSGQLYGGVAAGTGSLVNPRDWIQAALQNTVLANGTGGTMQNTAPIVNVDTPNGAAATADFYVYGRVFS